MTTGKHIVILGAGVIGLAAAHYCQRAGHRVTILERNAAVRDGCSFGNAGLICPSHFIPLASPGTFRQGLRWLLKPNSPLYIKPRFTPSFLGWLLRFYKASTDGHVARSAPLLRDLNFASRQLYEQLAQSLAASPARISTANSFALQNHGLLMLCKTAAALDEEIHLAEQAAKLGIQTNVLDPTSLAALDPKAQYDVLGAVHYPQDCHLSPTGLMAAFQRNIETHAGEFRWSETVTRTNTRVAGQASRIESVETQTPDGQTHEYCGDEFVLAAGVWSAALARYLRLNLPLEPGKGYSLTLDRPPEQPTIPAILTEARVAVTPLPGGAVRFGGTMELGGMRCADRISPRRVAAIARAAADYYPAFAPTDFASIKPWSGLRPCSPDGLPYLGRTAQYGNLLAAAGHAMLGISLAAITGKLIAELASDEPPSTDIHMLSPDRYSRRQ
jgi:D-amino-acid dehydrogenase